LKEFCTRASVHSDKKKLGEANTAKLPLLALFDMASGAVRLLERHDRGDNRSQNQPKVSGSAVPAQ